jgi:hypothetical protein
VDDTHPKVRAKLDELYRSLEPWQKIEILLGLNRMMDGVALVGIRERHPGCSEHEAQLHLAALKYGPELVEKAYGWRAAAGGGA